MAQNDNVGGKIDDKCGNKVIAGIAKDELTCYLNKPKRMYASIETIKAGSVKYACLY